MVTLDRNAYGPAEVTTIPSLASTEVVRWVFVCTK